MSGREWNPLTKQFEITSAPLPASDSFQDDGGAFGRLANRQDLMQQRQMQQQHQMQNRQPMRQQMLQQQMQQMLPNTMQQRLGRGTPMRPRMPMRSIQRRSFHSGDEMRLRSRPQIEMAPLINQGPRPTIQNPETDPAALRGPPAIGWQGQPTGAQPISAPRGFAQPLSAPPPQGGGQAQGGPPTKWTMEIKPAGRAEGGELPMYMGGGEIPMVYSDGGYIPAYGLGGFLKNIALKAAPLAASFFGGPLAGAGVGALISGIKNKSLKSALMGGAMGYLGGKGVQSLKGGIGEALGKEGFKDLGLLGKVGAIAKGTGAGLDTALDVAMDPKKVAMLYPMMGNLSGQMAAEEFEEAGGASGNVPGYSFNEQILTGGGNPLPQSALSGNVQGSGLSVMQGRAHGGELDDGDEDIYEGLMDYIPMTAGNRSGSRRSRYSDSSEFSDEFSDEMESGNRDAWKKYKPYMGHGYEDVSGGYRAEDRYGGGTGYWSDGAMPKSAFGGGGGEGSSVEATPFDTGAQAVHPDYIPGLHPEAYMYTGPPEGTTTTGLNPFAPQDTSGLTEEQRAFIEGAGGSTLAATDTGDAPVSPPEGTIEDATVSPGASTPPDLTTTMPISVDAGGVDPVTLTEAQIAGTAPMPSPDSSFLDKLPKTAATLPATTTAAEYAKLLAPTITPDEIPETTDPPETAATPKTTFVPKTVTEYEEMLAPTRNNPLSKEQKIFIENIGKAAPPEKEEETVTSTAEGGQVGERLEVPAASSIEDVPEEIKQLVAQGLKGELPPAMVDELFAEVEQLFPGFIASQANEIRAQQQMMGGLEDVVSEGYIPFHNDGMPEATGAVDDRLAVAAPPGYSDEEVKAGLQRALATGGQVPIGAVVRGGEFVIKPEDTSESIARIADAATMAAAKNPELAGGPAWEATTEELDMMRSRNA